MGCRRVSLLILCTFILGNLPHAVAAQAKMEYERQEIKVDEMADACASTPQKDQICSFILQVRQIGNDAVEAIKEYAQLSETEYALLTLANTAASQRIRLRSGIGVANAGITLDIKKNETKLIFDQTF